MTDKMIKFDIWFCGFKYRIEISKNFKDSSFSAYYKLIKIMDCSEFMANMVHELFECACVEHYRRFYCNDASKDFLFSFSHNELNSICQDVGGALSQILQEVDIYD